MSRRPDGTLDPETLNRATLKRQLLLGRTHLPALAALEHLIGLQAQAPHAPYVGLWSRLSGFHASELSELIITRQAVRAPLMRATLHLVSAADALTLRPIVQPVLERCFAAAPFDLANTDTRALIHEARALLAQQPRTRRELGSLLANRWRETEPLSLAYAITYLLPVVQVPPRGVWGAQGEARWSPLEEWLGHSLDPGPSIERLMLRYLAAFGPATVKDIQTWSGITRLGEVINRLRPQLRTFRNRQGAELFDLPDAPRPHPETPAPPRFLPEYDNLLLGHADRARFTTNRQRIPLPPGPGARQGTLLVNGTLHATWKISRDNQTAVLNISPSAGLLDHQEAIADEGKNLLKFLAPDATDHEIRFARTGTTKQ